MVESISMLWSLGWVFLFGVVIMVALPAIAAAIAGSHVSNVVVKHITMAPAVISSAARALQRPGQQSSGQKSSGQRLGQ
jgi:Tfp pilus assembly major pilin PilA